MKEAILKLKETNRFKITVLLVIMSIFAFSLSIFRFIVTDTKVFLFLNWNLFLAFIPWALSSFIMLKQIRSKFSLAVLIFVWLLFFPNSPYILTDLFHLKVVNTAPIWFDLVLILSFAWTGLVYGYASLLDIEELLEEYFDKKLVVLTTICFLFLSAFGIYLGRFLRWNSWDIISAPLGLFNDIFERFLFPLEHSRTWGMTILMGILLNMIFWSIKFFRK